MKNLYTELSGMSLQDLLRLLPRRIKFITIWHYLKITRGDVQANHWIISYGAVEHGAKTLRIASVAMLLDIENQGVVSIQDRIDKFRKSGYIEN